MKISKDIFVKAIVAGGDCGESHAIKVYADTKNAIHGFTTNLDLMMGQAMLEKDLDSAINNLNYAVSQITSAIEVLKKETE
jgi:hypothetical protein